jgi:hypothetical protein
VDEQTGAEKVQGEAYDTEELHEGAMFGFSKRVAAERLFCFPVGYMYVCTQVFHGRLFPKAMAFNSHL